ncbi:hypothetical protein [uncultured Rubinisphaera sp.]|uniref:hypothetical protein n=1 Tax=uncultured Rubinisphaera sp. TaxID=1678686 RepID=UPI0030DB9236|tara:strand:- start:258 stop:899 length:642 start_codon:yes stop_codon:yes gene_type:complete
MAIRIVGLYVILIAGFLCFALMYLMMSKIAITLAFGLFIAGCFAAITGRIPFLLGGEVFTALESADKKRSRINNILKGASCPNILEPAFKHGTNTNSSWDDFSTTHSFPGNESIVEFEQESGNQRHDGNDGLSNDSLNQITDSSWYTSDRFCLERDRDQEFAEDKSHSQSSRLHEVQCKSSQSTPSVMESVLTWLAGAIGFICTLYLLQNINW